ncbi:MAG: hypothetical protein IKH57_14800 [Clostridia bacterium]|nr:hypothetical protein [Clostridia bacterium]
MTDEKRARLLRALETFIVNPFWDHDQRNRKRLFRLVISNTLPCFFVYAPFLKNTFLVFDLRSWLCGGVQGNFPMLVCFFLLSDRVSRCLILFFFETQAFFVSRFFDD